MGQLALVTNTLRNHRFFVLNRHFANEVVVINEQTYEFQIVTIDKSGVEAIGVLRYEY